MDDQSSQKALENHGETMFYDWHAQFGYDLFGCVPVETQHATQLHWSQVRLLLQFCKPIASLYLETSVVLDERESYYKANAIVCTTCVFSQVCSQSLGLPENLPHRAGTLSHVLPGRV